MNRVLHVNWWDILWRYLLLTVGAIIAALSVIIFMAPFNIAPGGVSGIAVILNYKDPRLPIGLMIIIGNIPIQLLGYRYLGGWRVVVRTVFFVIVNAVLIDSLTPYLAHVTVGNDVLLNAVFGGILGGIGGGLVYRAGGTQGGTSTLGRIMQRKLGIPVSTSALYTDTGIILLAGLVFGWEAALYAMVALFIGGAASDYVLEGPSVIRTATIITDKPQEVGDGVLEEMGRGVTAWKGKGMFTDQEHTVLFVTISRQQVNELRALIHGIDPDAFVVIGQGHIAYGEGFKSIGA
ncbi:MAG: YitT family protein [Chloroflexota bacterium]